MMRGALMTAAIALAAAGGLPVGVASGGIDPAVQQANRERKAAERARRAPWKLAAAAEKRARKAAKRRAAHAVEVAR